MLLQALEKANLQLAEICAEVNEQLREDGSNAVELSPAILTEYMLGRRAIEKAHIPPLLSVLLITDREQWASLPAMPSEVPSAPVLHSASSSLLKTRPSISRAHEKVVREYRNNLRLLEECIMTIQRYTDEKSNIGEYEPIPDLSIIDQYKYNDPIRHMTFFHFAPGYLKTLRSYADFTKQAEQMRQSGSAFLDHAEKYGLSKRKAETLKAAYIERLDAVCESAKLRFVQGPEGVSLTR